MNDPQIGAQVSGQVRAADLVFISKIGTPDPALSLKLGIASGSQVIDLAQVDRIAPAILGIPSVKSPQVTGALHGSYVGWHHSGPRQLGREALMEMLGNRPEGLFRFKGFVAHDAETAWEVQCVGASISVKPLAEPRMTQVVGIGLSSRITKPEIEDWW